jgi:hypothetical protein
MLNGSYKNTIICAYGIQNKVISIGLQAFADAWYPKTFKKQLANYQI